MQNHWILEVLAALLVLLIMCFLGTMFVQGVRQENACWRAGYDTPINYAGNVYCFGRDGRPEIVALAALSQE